MRTMPQAFIDNTYTCEFYHEPNNLTICVDVVSPDDVKAVEFARRRFNLDASWELVGVDKKYN